MKFELINWFLSLSRVTKRSLMICIDVLLIVAVLLLSFSVRLGEWFWPQGDLVYLIFFAPLVAIPIFIKFGQNSIQQNSRKMISSYSSLYVCVDCCEPEC